MIEFKRDPDTGEVIAYCDGVEVGPVVTMGDELEDSEEETTVAV